MKKKIIAAVVCAAVVICGVALVNKKEYSRTEYMLNTVITITANDKDAVAECFNEIRRIENLLSAYLPNSEVSAINSAPNGTPVKVSAETFALIKKAEEYRVLTDGAFDITIKPITDLWDVSGEGYIPTDDELNEKLSLVAPIILDEENLTVILPTEGMSIDLGGIAKGYAGDRVYEMLVSHGVKSAIADLGGNIVTVGRNRKKPWKIGIQDPSAPRGTVCAYIDIEDKFVVTSGDYERYFEKDGQTYHHIFDPSTGRNPENNVSSVTIVSDDCTLADALSTACFVSGKDKALELAEKCGVDVAVCTADGMFYTNNINIHTEDK